MSAETFVLYPPQNAVVERILKEPLRRHLLSAEMGCGKSAMAASVCKELGAENVLVVGPSVTKVGWTRELAKWWRGHPEIGLISVGKGREKGLSKAAIVRKTASFESPIQIVSYDLVEHVRTSNWRVIILDEIHRTQNPASQQAIAVTNIARANPEACILGLTGTPMADKPTGIWGPLDILFPGRFGLLDRNGKGCWKFNDRYSNRTHNGHGYSFSGINERNVDELRRRLVAVSSRLTKKDLAAFLPPLVVQTLRIPRARGDFRMLGSSEKALEQTLVRIGEEKLGPALEWLEDTLQSSRKVVVFTYGIELAESISARAQKLRGAPAIFTITGKVPADKRQALVDQFQEAPSALCVASMKSVGIGINGLDCATDVLFAELYYRPETLSQALGRFNRLSSKEPTTVSLLVLESTLDEAMALKLQSKIAAINSAIKAGQSEAGLETAFEETAEDEARLLKELENYSNAHIDDNEYLV